MRIKPSKSWCRSDPYTSIQNWKPTIKGSSQLSAIGKGKIQLQDHLPLFHGVDRKRKWIKLCKHKKGVGIRGGSSFGKRPWYDFRRNDVWGCVDWRKQAYYNIYRIMQKKNLNQRRFNTAAARIMISSKLPHDFFHPSREKDGRQSSLYSYRHEDVEKHPTISINCPKDPLLFTFRRSSSEDKIRLREGLFAPERPLAKNKSGKNLQTKLPPVSINVPKQNSPIVAWGGELRGNKERLKKLGRISNRILHESSLMREQICEAIR